MFQYQNNTVELDYIEHSLETAIGSIWRGFVISERLLRHIKSKGNENDSIKRGLIMTRV